MTQPNNELIPAREAAKTLLHSSYWKLLEMCKMGQLPHVKIGNRIFLRPSAIEKWIEEQEIKSVQRGA